MVTVMVMVTVAMMVTVEMMMVMTVMTVMVVMPDEANRPLRTPPIRRAAATRP